jgi:hypothetical protein
MRLIKDIVYDSVILKMDNKLKVKTAGAWDSTTQTQVVTLCNEKWLRLFGFVFNPVGTRLEVASYNINGTITLSVSNPLDALERGQTITIQRPYFFHGTLYSTTEEWEKFADNERDKLPFIWLVYHIEEDFKEPQDAVERSSPLRLVFVHWSDWVGMTNEQRMDGFVKPLTAAVDGFIHAIDSNRAVFKEHKGFRIKTMPKFGIDSANGTTNTVFNSTLCAAELNINLEIFKENNCIC